MPREKRTVRSFVRRTGRMTEAQSRALDELWPAYGIEYSAVPLDLDAVFRRNAERVLEIGFGNGESLVEQASSCPERDFIGIEVHRPGIGHCLLHTSAGELSNLRIISQDAMDVLEQQIGDGQLARINLYFPDPWPKKRHHKRRIIQAAFLGLAATRLAPGGNLHIATDWAPYAEHIDEILRETGLYTIAERRVHDGDNPLDRPTTKFEQRGLKKGHKIVDWILCRN
jgi:tRNA (guanine-N7-)-methyltransferase